MCEKLLRGMARASLAARERPERREVKKLRSGREIGGRDAECRRSGHCWHEARGTREGELRAREKAEGVPGRESWIDVRWALN